MVATDEKCKNQKNGKYVSLKVKQAIACDYNENQLIRRELAVKYNDLYQTVRSSINLRSDIVDIDPNASLLSRPYMPKQVNNKYVAVDNYILEQLVIIR